MESIIEKYKMYISTNTRKELTEHNKACDMKRNNSMTERMNKNEPPKYWRNPFKGEKMQ